eukprot:3130766-Amphidinium_carterae.1
MAAPAVHSPIDSPVLPPAAPAHLMNLKETTSGRSILTPIKEKRHAKDSTKDFPNTRNSK